MKQTSTQAQPSQSSRSTGTKAFVFLLVTVRAFFGALVNWDVRCFCPLVCLTVIAGLRACRRPQVLLHVLVSLLLIFPACKKTERVAGGNDAAVISALVTAEETSLKLSAKMSALSKDLLGLRLPAPVTEKVFAPSVSVSDLGPVPAMTAVRADMLESRVWPLATGMRDVTEVDLWRPLLDAVATFEHAKLYIIDGDHPDGDPAPGMPDRPRREEAASKPWR